MNSCSNYEHSNIKNCPICGKQSLSASNHYCRDHTNSDDTDKYNIDYDGVVCTEVNWKTKEFYFTFKGKEYKYKQQGDISCNADTDHIRCVIKEFKEKTKDEENDMENYIVINGKRAELTEEQLNQLGINVEVNKETPFTRKPDKLYWSINAMNLVTGQHECNDNFDNTTYEVVNYFNDYKFAEQVALHQLLYRKLLKYAYEHDAVCDTIMFEDKPKYYIAQNIVSHIFTVLVQYQTKCADVYFSKEQVAREAINDVIKPFMEEHPEFVW